MWVPQSSIEISNLLSTSVLSRFNVYYNAGIEIWYDY